MVPIFLNVSNKTTALKTLGMEMPGCVTEEDLLDVEQYTAGEEELAAALPTG